MAQRSFGPLLAALCLGFLGSAAAAEPKEPGADLIWQHPRAVDALAFTPDGKMIVSGSGDGNIRIADAASGRVLRMFTGHQATVAAVAFSPDGKVLASAGFDNSVRLWDPATGAALRRCAGHTFPVLSLAFSPDGKVLASGSDDWTVRLWNVANGKELPSARPPGDGDGACLRGGRPDAGFWQTGTAASASGTLPLQNRCASRSRSTAVSTGCHFTPMAPRSRVAGMAREVVLFNLETRSAASIGERHGWLSSVAFSPDGRLLATAGHDGTACVWEVASGKALRHLTGHGDNVTAAVFAPDGWSVATASADRTVRLWKLVDGGRHEDRDIPAEELQTCWIDLGSNPDQAYRAIHRLLASPRQAVALVAGHIEHSKALTAEQIDRLVRDLDSSTFDTRQRAMRRLEAEGKTVETALRRSPTGRLWR